MVKPDTFRTMCLAYPQSSEQPHFEKTSFRVGKKIFATLTPSGDQACLKLSPADQGVFCSFDKTVVWPVPNKWGAMGWTFVNLKKVRKEMMSDMLNQAYCEVAPKKLAEQVRTNI